MSQSEEDRRQARENRLKAVKPFDRISMLERIDPDFPLRAMRRFIPPGYVCNEPVLIAVAEHLFAGEAGKDDSEWESAQAVLRCIHFLRGLLFECKIRAHYPWFGGFVCIDPGYWLGDEANRALMFGEVHDGRTLVPLLFEAGAIEAALAAPLTPSEAPSNPETPAPSMGGRPRKIDAVLAAYDALYPAGHRRSRGWRSSQRLGPTRREGAGALRRRAC